jgi:hypothetical protein
MLLSPHEVDGHRVKLQQENRQEMLDAVTKRVNHELVYNTNTDRLMEVVVLPQEVHVVEEIVDNLREKGWDAQYTVRHANFHYLIIKPRVEPCVEKKEDSPVVRRLNKWWCM